MKFTEDDIEQLLEWRGARQRKAMQEASASEGRKPALRVLDAPADRLGGRSGWSRLERWLPTFVGAAAAVVISLVSARLHVPPVATHSGQIDWTVRSANSTQSDEFLRRGQLGVPGWRRAGLVIAVSDYSSFRRPPLPDLPLATTDAGRARRVLETESGAARENIISLSNGMATEAAARSAILWLKQFDQPGDLIFIHVAAHGCGGPDGRLKVALSDSLETGTGAVTGLPLADLLRGLAGLRSTTVLVADVCQGGVLEQLPLGPRQCLVASASPSELAIDSAFGEAWFKGLEGEADTNGDGIITLREAFEAVSRKIGGLQHPVLQEGRVGLADEIILNTHPLVTARLAEPGPPALAPGSVEFVPDGPCQVWMDNAWLGVVTRPVTLIARPGTVVLRAVREGWSGQNTEWLDKEPAMVRSREMIQRVAVFGPPTASEQKKPLRLVGNDLAASPFPRLEVFGSPKPRAEFNLDGELVIEQPRDPAECGVVLLAEDALAGVDVAAKTGARPGETVTLSISVKCESGTVEATFFAGGRANESLTPQIEKKTTLDDQWQNVTVALPAEKIDRVVTAFGVVFQAGDGSPKKIRIRDITFQR